MVPDTTSSWHRTRTTAGKTALQWAKLGSTQTAWELVQMLERAEEIATEEEEQQQPEGKAILAELD